MRRMFINTGDAYDYIYKYTSLFFFERMSQPQSLCQTDSAPLLQSIWNKYAAARGWRGVAIENATTIGDSRMRFVFVRFDFNAHTTIYDVDDIYLSRRRLNAAQCEGRDQQNRD